MSLTRNLYYYCNGAYQDISDYVLSISKLEYGIGSLDSGTAIKMQVILDTNCPYYGTKNKYKLLIGSNYTLLGVPKDGIENIGGYKIAITLIDYFFASMYKKAPLKITGKGDVTSLAGEGLTLNTINDFVIPYSTNQGDFEADNFSSKDDINFYDGQGNAITIANGKSAVKYKTEGHIKAANQAGDLGQAYVSIRDVLNNIAVAEGFTLDVDFGAEEANSYGTIDISTLSRKKTWDAKVINGVIVALSSGTATINLDSFDTDNNIVDNLSWVSRDWAEDADGVDFIPYQIFPDYRNNCCYIPGWYCASYVHDDPTNTYIFRILKISVAADGTLTQDYDAKDTGGSYFWNWLMDPAYRAGMQARDYRFSSTLAPITGWDNLTWYTDEDLAGESKFRIILRKGSGSTDMHVIDPDLWQASSANSIYTYTLGAMSGWIVPDWMNGSVVHIYHDGSNYVKDFYRVDMAILTAGYTVSGNGGTIHADDDPSNNTLPPIGIWRESIIYTNTIPLAAGTFYYHPPQVPNGHLVRERVYNNYIKDKSNFLNTNYLHDYPRGGSAWDDSIDKALIWHTETDEDPDDLYWDIADNYTQKRLYLYQPCTYKNRTEQFLDALVSNGFFYEQRDGNVRLTRIKWDNTYVYLANHTDGIKAYSYDGKNLVEIGSIDDAGNIYAVWSDGSYIYAVDYSNATLRAYSFDGSTFTFIDSITTDASSHGVWGDGKYIYVACYSSGLRAYIFNGTVFTFVTTIDDGGGAKDVWGNGTYIFLANLDDGLRAYKWSGTTLVNVGHIDNGGNAYGVCVDGQNIFLANDGDGLRVYRFDGSTFTNIDHIDDGGNAYGVWSDGINIFLANQADGVRSYTFDDDTLVSIGHVALDWAKSVWGDGKYIYATSGADKLIKVYQYDGSDFTEVGTDTLSTDGKKVFAWNNVSGSNIGNLTDNDLLNVVKIDGFTEYAEKYNLKVLGGIKTKGIGEQEKGIETIISEYGWFSMWQMDFYSDWASQINSKKKGVILSIDLESFYGITSIRLPMLGDKVNYNAEEYIIIKVGEGIENWIIDLTCVRT